MQGHGIIQQFRIERRILPYLKIYSKKCLGAKIPLERAVVQRFSCLSIHCLTPHQACEIHLSAISKAVSSKTTNLYRCLRRRNSPINAGPSIASSTSNCITKQYKPSKILCISANFSNLIHLYLWTLPTLPQQNPNTTTSHGGFFLQSRNDRRDPQSRIAYRNT